MRALLPIVLLSVLGFTGCQLIAKPPSLDYNQLRGGMSSAEVRALPPKLAWECLEPVSGRGPGSCEAKLSELDGLKAASLKHYFRDGKLVATTVEYNPGAYEALVKLMDSRYARAGKQATGTTAWRVADGLIATGNTELVHGNVAVLWASAAESKRAAGDAY